MKSRQQRSGDLCWEQRRRGVQKIGPIVRINVPWQCQCVVVVAAVDVDVAINSANAV